MKNEEPDLQATSNSIFTFEANRRYSIEYLTGKFLKYYGAITIAMIIINACSKLFRSEYLIPWELVVAFPIFLLTLKILEGEFYRPAFKIILDVDSRKLEFFYTTFYYHTRSSKFKFDDVKVDFGSKETIKAEKLIFLTKDMKTICTVSKEEGLFSEESFISLTEKLSQLYTKR